VHSASQAKANQRRRLFSLHWPFDAAVRSDRLIKLVIALCRFSVGRTTIQCQSERNVSRRRPNRAGFRIHSRQSVGRPTQAHIVTCDEMPSPHSSPSFSNCITDCLNITISRSCEHDLPSGFWHSACHHFRSKRRCSSED
jgi:hypothetical protein